MSMSYGGSLRLDIAFATGFVVETGIYCAYTCLFFAALPRMTSAMRLKNGHSSHLKSAWVFLVFCVLMYVVASLHLIFAAFRFYKSIFLGVDPKGAVHYLWSWHHWEYFGLIVLYCVQTWLGDALVIYRCYIVWDSNLFFIFIPLGLLLASVGTNVVIWYWIFHPLKIAPKEAIRVFKWIYPLAFVQNVMTTGLIILKIFLQHRASQKAGVRHARSVLSLMRVVRVVVESAAIYTLQLLILIILYFRNDNGQYVVQAAVNPSIGITFILLALRIHPSGSTNTTSEAHPGRTSTVLPQWLRNTESGDVDSEHSKDDPRSHELGIELTATK